MEQDAMKELLVIKEQAEMANSNANHDFQIILSSKDLKSAIKEAVIEWDINLVIMGTKGATGAKEFFFGSNTIDVIKTLKICPTLIIPEEYDFNKPLQIAFPTDYNRFYSHKELRPLTQLVDLYDSKIRIMHINIKENLNELQKYNLVKLKEYLQGYEFSFHWMPDYAKKVVEINDFIEELNIDILAMINYKHSLIEKIINEPVIKKIGFHPNIPFLIIPE